jgi:hypothetical protein
VRSAFNIKNQIHKTVGNDPEILNYLLPPRGRHRFRFLTSSWGAGK